MTGDTALLKFKRVDDCPDRAKHTSHPHDYVSHAHWADKMLKTHKQKRCPTCGYWTIWAKR